MVNRPIFSPVIFKGPISGLGVREFPSTERGGNGRNGMECGQPAIPGDGIGFQNQGDAVRGVKVNAWLFPGDGPAGSGPGKAMQGLEENLVGGIRPGKGGKGGFLL